MEPKTRIILFIRYTPPEYIFLIIKELDYFVLSLAAMGHASI